MRNHNPEELYKITLRVNRHLLEEIRRAAERDSRSINSYLTHKLLQELMPQHFDKPTAPKKK